MINAKGSPMSGGQVGEASASVAPQPRPVFTTRRRRRLSTRWRVAVVVILVVAASLRIPDLQRVPLPLADEVVATVDFHYLLKTGHHFDGSQAGILAYVTPALDGRFAISLGGG